MKILIADDDPDARNILKLTIEMHGHEAIEASDGLEGLNKAKTHKPNLIISDALMPRMDGFQFLMETKTDKNLKLIPFVFYSATYTGADEVKLAISLGAEGYIIKPKSPEEFWEELNVILEESKKEKTVTPALIEKDEEYLRKYSHIVAAKLETKVKELEKALTERGKTEETLKKSEKKFRTLFESANDTIFILDLKGNFIDVNKAAYERLGYTKEEMMSKHITQLDPPEFAAKVPERLEQITKYGKAVFESAHIKKDGTVMPVEINTQIIDFDGRKVFFSIIRDITERKQLLENITKAKKEWEMTFDSASELIILIDRAHRILRCNKSFADFFGMPITEPMGKYCLDFLPYNPEQIESCKGSVQKGEAIPKLEVKTKTGHWFYLSFCPIMDERGNFLTSIVTATDITALKNTEEKLTISDEDLKKRVKELEKFYDIAVGRELKMKELKKEIKRLNEELSRYKTGS